VLCALWLSGSARAGLTRGLSRMMGNHQVRFLGEGTAAMPFPYPTPSLSGRHQPAFYDSSQVCYAEMNNQSKLAKYIRQSAGGRISERGH